MDEITARKLIALNTAFYRAHAPSFSATRSAPWHGWRRCVQEIRAKFGEAPQSLSILDVACGNLRFEAYAAAEFPAGACSFWALDDCEALAGEALERAESSGVRVRYRPVDVLSEVAEGRPLAEHFGQKRHDVAVSFGFMHHVPGVSWRHAVLTGMVEAVRPGGLVCASFWRFMDHPALAAKARAATQEACAAMGPLAWDENDWLLGWQEAAASYRYCHHFTNREIDELADGVSARARVVARFRSDGRSDDLNEYVVFEVT